MEIEEELSNNSDSDSTISSDGPYNEENDDSGDDHDDSVGDDEEVVEEDEEVVEEDEDEDENLSYLRSPLKTKNEIVDIVINKPSVEITPEMELQGIGQVLHIVENYIVIDSELSGELQVLDSDSILVLEDREVLGQVFI